MKVTVELPTEYIAVQGRLEPAAVMVLFCITSPVLPIVGLTSSIIVPVDVGPVDEP